jgi:hypothetical protein
MTAGPAYPPQVTSSNQSESVVAGHKKSETYGARSARKPRSLHSSAVPSETNWGAAMEMVQWFERRKQWCEEQLRLAETDPNFRLLRRTHGGGQIDLTEMHKKDLRDARDKYQRAIDHLKAE